MVFLLRDNPVLNSNNEVWKDCVGFEDLYQVSNLGNVKSIRNNKGTKQDRLLKPATTSTSDYLYVQFCIKGITKKHSIHRLVAKAFIANPANKPTVNHIDGNKLNNNACNLEWNTYSENIKHAYSNGLNTHSRSSLAVKQGNTSKFIYVNYDATRDRFAATVKILGTRKSLQKNFSCKKYGTVEAEKLAAITANQFLDQLNDTERPRNIIT